MFREGKSPIACSRVFHGTRAKYDCLGASKNTTALSEARLAPEVAHMQWLQELAIFAFPLSGSIPKEWGFNGSFPSLKWQVATE